MFIYSSSIEHTLSLIKELINTFNWKVKCYKLIYNIFFKRNLSLHFNLIIGVENILVIYGLINLNLALIGS